MSPHKKPYLEATKDRRTYYQLEAKSPISDKDIISLAEHAILNVPSAFNNQSTRMTVLLKAEHHKLWDIVGAALLKKIGKERWESGTKARIAGFKAAYGSILFWDDPGHVDQLQKTGGDLYSDKAAEWTHQSNGMHQYFMWCALEAAGCGVNLQHYNPLIDDEVKKTWGLPEHWNMKAQMVFGTIAPEAVLKEKVQHKPISERLHAFGFDD